MADATSSPAKEQGAGALDKALQDAPALRGVDGGFTATSITQRLARIMRSACAVSKPGAAAQCVDAVEALAASMEAGADIPPLQPAPTSLPTTHRIDSAWAEAWEGAFPAGSTWLTAPWFDVEAAAYRLLLSALRQDGVEGALKDDSFDPFAAQKAALLQAAEQPWAQSVVPLLGHASDTEQLLLRALWGNRADLSLSGGDPVTHETQEAGGAAPGPLARGLLADDSTAALALLGGSLTRGVCMVLDNAGLELLSDLALADHLLNGNAPHVTLLCKPAPIFVSDALPGDVRTTIDWLAAGEVGGATCPATQALGARLQGCLGEGRLRITTHDWTVSRHALWEAPHDLWSELRAHSLVIVKGDANYRRLLGDRLVPFDTPWTDVLRYAAGVNLIALRTAKSGVLAGTPLSVCAAAQAFLDPTAPTVDVADWDKAKVALLARDAWLTSGKFGVVQVHRGI